MNFQSVLAETFFSSTNFRLKGPPTYCIITPDDDKIPDSKKITWTKLARDAVLEWEEKLKDAESENDQLWEMKVRIVPQGDDIPSDCDIELSFKEKDFFTNTLVGVFSWPDNKIKIFYVQPQECALFIWCFYDTLRSDSVIYATALHEIGHSVSLDHYVSDDNAVNILWQTSNIAPPSVMIPSLHIFPTLQQITDKDVEKVRSVYGSSGFYAFSSVSPPGQPSIPVPEPEPVPEPIPEPVPEPIPEPEPVPEPEPEHEQIPEPEIISPIIPVLPFESINSSPKKIILSPYETKIVKISGTISEDEFLKGHPVILTVHRPDQSAQVLRILVTESAKFETFLIFDKDAQLGMYSISASYIKHVDKKMDLTFEIITAKDLESETIIDILTPKKQIQQGISINGITCKPNYLLVFKASDDSPACIKPDTLSKLLQRGWIGSLI